MTRTRATCVGITILLAAVAATAQTPAGAARPLATVNAIVEMSDGTPVVDLTRDDFEVAIDGLVQRIETFSKDDAPVTFVLLVDLTWSVSAWLKPETLIEAIRADVVPNMAAGDRLRFERIEMESSDPPGFLTSPGEILRASRRAFTIDDERSAGASPLWDRTMTAVSVLASEPGRRAVVLLSDGQATGNRRSVEDATMHALMKRVVIHSVMVGEDLFVRQSETVAARIRPGVAMQQIADLTGGIFVRDLSFPRKPGPRLGRVFHSVHCSYTIGFVPEVGERAARVLRVAVKRPGLRVRAPQDFAER